MDGHKHRRAGDRPRALDDIDVVVFPGGSGSAQADALEPDGRIRVCEFVAAGGGYVGICGGAFLASAHYGWSLALLPATVMTSQPTPGADPRVGLWFRGAPADVTIEITDAATRIAGHLRPTEIRKVQYHNGPIFTQRSTPPLEPFVTVARYRSEVWRVDEQRGTMVDTPAIVATTFGAGRVLAIGPHLEEGPAHAGLLLDLMRWSLGGST